jgi:predicted DNA-binding transcriptional regulator YafY
MLEATYEPMLLDPEKDYAGTFGRYSTGDEVAVRLKFTAACRPFLLRRTWHSSQKLTELPDGGFELEFQVKGILGIRPWLYRWLPDVTVEAPPELAELVVKELEEALSRQREVNKGG